MVNESENNHEVSFKKDGTVKKCEEELEECEEEPYSRGSMSVAQKARAERNRLRARALRDARLVQRPELCGSDAPVPSKALALDTGGGFLPEVEEPRALRPPHAPLVHRAEQPRCLQCEQRFPMSYLYDTFDYSVCDACRDEEDAHALITRTEAKSEFLLKDCDLDARPPPLRCVRRPNPHRARAHDMRLYLRAQVERRALDVWGSAEALRAERAAREQRRLQQADRAARRRLRALRMDVRSSLFDRTRAAHEHAFGPERYDAAADEYSRECACGHRETYEKL